MASAHRVVRLWMVLGELEFSRRVEHDRCFCKPMSTLCVELDIKVHESLLRNKRYSRYKA
jgi:hypothetical protein